MTVMAPLAYNARNDTTRLLLRRLVESGRLRCPHSGNRLFFDLDGSVRSRGTGQPFEVASGAIDLFGDYEPGAELCPPPEDFVKNVARGLGIAQDPGSLEATARAVAATQLKPRGSRQIAAEIRELASRMKIEEPVGWPPVGPAGPKPGEMPAPLSRNQDVKIAFVRHYIDGSLPAGQSITRSIRIRNEGQSILSSAGSCPVHISYHWADERGHVIVFEGVRSALPVEFPPGEELTVCVSIETPERPGKYRLQVRVVQEFVAWHETTGLDIPVTLKPQIHHSLSDAERVDADYEYKTDVIASRQFLMQRYPIRADGPRYLLLEIGGGVYPLAIPLSRDRADVVSFDVSFAQCQLGSLVHSQPGMEADPAHFLYVAADATALPVRPGCADGIVFCAALHHFPDPSRLLQSLIPFLKPTGSIVIVREPCQPNPQDVAYLEGLQLGINEQQWTPEEYAVLFERAGLKPVRSLIRSQFNLMAVLRPACSTP